MIMWLFLHELSDIDLKRWDCKLVCVRMNDSLN